MAFDFYFAGTQALETEELLVKLNANVLKSYVNDTKVILRYFEYKRKGWKGKLLIDSGAFTVHRQGGTIDIDKYIDWLNMNDEYIDYAIELDHIPGKWGEPRTKEQILMAPEISYQNYLYMYSKMKSPHKLLPVFHQYESFKWLETLLKNPNCNYICISGNKEITNKQREQWYSECYSYIHKIRPTIKVHCLGSATLMNAEKFPFTSMDATTWIMTGANGNIQTDCGVVYVGDGGKSLAKHEKEVVTELLKKYNMTLEEVSTDYKARMLYNIHWMFDRSQNCSYKGKLIKKGKLF